MVFFISTSKALCNGVLRRVLDSGLLRKWDHLWKMYWQYCRYGRLGLIRL